MNLFFFYFYFCFSLFGMGREGALMMMMMMTMMMSLFWPETMALPLPLCFWVMWKVMFFEGGGKCFFPTSKSQLQNILGWGWARIKSPKRSWIPSGFGEEMGSQAWSPPIIYLHSGGVGAAWKWWKGRNPPQNVQVVLLFPESQNCPKTEGFRASSNLPWAEFSQPGPKTQLGQRVAKMSPNPAPNPRIWGFSRRSSEEGPAQHHFSFLSKYFPAPPKKIKNLWAFHITEQFRVWGVHFSSQGFLESFCFRTPLLLLLFYYY